jgi:Gas vesicle synthesis protein GvpO
VRRIPVALQRQRRKRDRRKREDDDRVIRLDDQQRGQQDGDREEGDEQERDQEGHPRKQDEDEEPRQQEEGRRAEVDQDRESQDREPSAEDESRDRDDRDEDEDRTDAREDRRSEPLPALEILDAAKDQLTVLTGRVPDSVSGLRRSDSGWRMKIDMVELERIPPSTSVMATYEVELDRDGNVVGYEQERRFVRGQAED